MMYTAGQIAERVGGQLNGPAGLELTGLNTVDEAGPGDLTFIGDERYAAKWPACSASAALVKRGILVPAGPAAEGHERAVIQVDDADLALMRMLELLQPERPPAVFDTASPVMFLTGGRSVHRTAVVAASATLGEGVQLGPHAVVGPDAHIGDGTVLHAGAVVMHASHVGRSCVFWPGATLRERCRVGDRCILGSHSVVGGEGFGYRPGGERDGLPILVWLPHIGSVVLGDEVEIGSGTCIDRGKLANTTVGTGTKIDNLCQIGHNCRIGRSVVISGCSALAGSVEIGDACTIGGGVAIADHFKLGPGASIAGRAAVMSDVPAGEQWSGYPARPHRDSLLREALLRKLPDLMAWWRKR